MMRAFRCEWTKLWRLRQAIAVWGTMAGLLALFVTLFFGTAGTEARAPGPGRQASFLTLAQLAQPEGLTVTLQVAAQILGAVTLVVVAGSMAGEYTQGTLKSLLARDPSRLRVLAGKTAALLLYAAIGILLAALIQGAIAAAVASARGIDTSSWWTADTLGDAALLVGRLVLAAWAWGLMGLMLAVLLRASPPAIGIGLAYTILVEGLLGLVLPDVAPYMPGQALQAFVRWGAPGIGQALAEVLSGPSAAAVGAAYAAAFAIVAATVFDQRDVTS